MLTLQHNHHLLLLLLLLLHALQYASDASAARDAQQFLQAAHRQARQKEAEVLAAADAGAVMPLWSR